MGLPAGSVRRPLVGVQLPTDTPLLDGSTISNTADIIAANANLASSTVSSPVSIPRVVTPVASKSWPDSSPVAQSGATSTITLGIANRSSTSAQVSQLTVADTSADTFNDFDLVSLGTVAFPKGADQVATSVCTQPVGTPCTRAQLVTGPFGPAAALPPGVAPGQVTGVQFAFRNSVGTVLPVDATGGTVPLTVKLRDTVRSTGRR